VATIRERRPGVWEVRGYTGKDRRGRPTQVSRTVHGAKRDAQQVAAQLTLQPSRHAGGRTVAELLDEWRARNEGAWSPASKRDQAGRVALVKRDPIARMKVARISVADVDRWHARLRKAVVGEASIRNQHCVLRAALTQAVRWGWVQTNVATTAQLASPKTMPRGVLALDDVRRVIDAARALDAGAGLAIRLAAVTGARRAELAALRWEDLDGDRLTIDSAIGTIRSGSRGDPSDPILEDAPTKTANIRTVTLDPETVQALEARRAERERYSPWMFSLDDGPPNPDHVGYWWRRARKLAGIDPRWRLHDLRHWSATQAIASGHDPRTVAGRLGHANAAMTMRTYAHPLTRADRAVAATLGEILSGDERETRRP
jgi:integrase